MGVVPPLAVNVKHSGCDLCLSIEGEVGGRHPASVQRIPQGTPTLGWDLHLYGAPSPLPTLP